MAEIKTYAATITVTFEAHEEERPRSIAKSMAGYFNGMRGANLHSCGELGQVRLVPCDGWRSTSPTSSGHYAGHGRR